MSDVDVEAVLAGLAAKNKQKLDWRRSIVDLMKLLDLDSSFTARKQLVIYSTGRVCGQIRYGKIRIEEGGEQGRLTEAPTLELVRTKRAPAVLALHEPDAILLLGLIVAKEMGYATPMALRPGMGARMRTSGLAIA